MPQADVLYACDAKWWLLNNGAPDFRGLRVSQDASACETFPLIHRVWLEKRGDVLVDDILTEMPGWIGAGGNGGFQTLNLAVQWGSPRIILVGFDMNVDKGTHWHGRHLDGLNNPSAESTAQWREILDGAAPRLAQLGVSVINASPESALTAYPKMSVSEAIELWCQN